MNGWNLNLADVKMIQTPLSYLDALCAELYRMTNGKIIARVVEYTPVEGEENDDSHFLYEMYVTSVKTPRYKYWIFDLSYDIMLYPVGLSIRSDIRKEIGAISGSTSGPVFCEDEAKFRAIVEKVIGSKTMGIVLNNLAALNGLSETEEESLPF